MTPDQIIGLAVLSGWFIGGLIGIWSVKKIVAWILAKTPLGRPSDSFRALLVTYVLLFLWILLAIVGNRAKYEDLAEHSRIAYVIIAAFLVSLVVDLFRKSRRDKKVMESD